MNLKDRIEKLALVGPTYGKKLEKLNIETIEDLIFHFPFRYDDFSLISPIGRVQAGETVTICGQIQEIVNEYTRGGKKIQKAIVSDSSGSLEIVWFNQPFLVRTFRVGKSYNFSGKVDWFGRQKVFVSPDYELQKSGTSIHTGRLVPVYPETFGVSSKWLRSRIKTALELLGEEIKEFLPLKIIKNENLLPEKEAIFQIHFPDSKVEAEKARERLAFDELFLLQLAALKRKKDWQKKTLGKKFSVDQEKVLDFIAKLPFELTQAQKKVLKEILADLGKTKPMNRLLQGDVGSGKTVVAAAAAYVCFLNGWQTLFMAPTEILANQHYQTLKILLEPLGIPLELITSSKKTKVSTNKTKVSIGTHALLYQKFEQEKIGLVVVDEQHRFGVEQRKLLAKKGGSPHFLTMTATPIPRTIALSLFGDLDLSRLDEMPQGRLRVKTWVVPQEKRQDAYQWIRSQVKDSQKQAFIICPFIEESESLSSVKAAKKEFELLSQVIFPDLKLGLLHGRVKAKEKEQVLGGFRAGKIDILVATPVVEVGIDIPKATIMVIEAADRFGLAQLHQLRGRVGRSQWQSYCFLFTENENPQVLNRLKTMEHTHIGMELAEIDLKLRGPGEIYGTKQHGFPDLRVASFTDLVLIQKTRLAAESVLKQRVFSPKLKTRLQKYKIETVNN